MTEAARAVPGRIFLSYRREETARDAGWLYDRLARHLGDGQVFKDVDSLELGDDPVDAIVAAVGSCEVLLALIGDRWLSITGDDGRRRLDDPEDFVRLEIETALARGIRVIPILAAGARMPGARDLPPSLAGLARRQALELRFGADLTWLLQKLELRDRIPYAEGRLPGPAGPVPSRPSQWTEKEAVQGSDQPVPAPSATWSSKPASYDHLVSRAFDEEIHPGRLIFNPPRHMRLGDTERVEVVLARTFELDAELLQNLRGDGTPQLEEIPTSPTMAVALHGDGFQITALSDEEQDITPDGSATWEFNIQAVKRGLQRLYISVSLRIPVPGQPLKRKSIPVREATIDVKVGAPALVGHFVSQNWQWFIGTAIAAAAVIVAILVH